MKKNGFTLVELLGVIVVLAIVSGLVVVSITGVIGTSKNSVYLSYEKSFKSSVENYFIDNNNLIPNAGSSKKIYLKDMISNGYIEEIKDPNGGNCNISSNNSYVLVTRPSSDTNNYKLDYKTCLICKKGSIETYKSSTC